MNIIQSNLSFRSNLSYGNNPDMIILHHAEASSCTVQDIHSWHLQQGWAGIGYHYFVRKDGSIYTGRPENAIGSHCLHYNAHSIGICAEGDYMKDAMPEAQKKALIELGQYIKNKYGIGTVGGHKEYYQTDCPGTNYPLAEIKAAILSGQAVTSGTSTPQATSQAPTVDNTVKIIQAQLNTLTHAGLTVDGIAGPNTTAKIKEFQTVMGITVDGIWGNQCANCVAQIYTKPVLQLGSKGIAVKLLQFRLGIQFDGVFGNITKIKVQNWQAANRLVADGIVGAQSWNKLIG